MVKVYTKEHIAQMRIKDSPYAGAAHILGYGDKQREWIDGIKDARKAEEKRQKRKKIPGAFLKASGYLGVFLFVIGLFAGGFHVLSQAHNGGATTKPAVTSSVTDSPTPTPSSTPTATSKCTTVIGSYSVSTGICKNSEVNDSHSLQVDLKFIVGVVIMLCIIGALIADRDILLM
jgi:hypothetical protein